MRHVRGVWRSAIVGWPSVAQRSTLGAGDAPDGKTCAPPADHLGQTLRWAGQSVRPSMDRDRCWHRASARRGWGPRCKLSTVFPVSPPLLSRQPPVAFHLTNEGDSRGADYPVCRTTTTVASSGRARLPSASCCGFVCNTGGKSSTWKHQRMPSVCISGSPLLLRCTESGISLRTIAVAYAQ